MTNEEAQKILDELQGVRPEVLNDEAKRLFEAIMTIANGRDKAESDLYEANNRINDLLDIVKQKDEFSDVTDRYLIDYDEDDLSYVFQNISNKNRFIALEDLYDEDYGDYAIEVIGNIYENPELLERR